MGSKGEDLKPGHPNIIRGGRKAPPPPPSPLSSGVEGEQLHGNCRPRRLLRPISPTHILFAFSWLSSEGVADENCLIVVSPQNTRSSRRRSGPVRFVLSCFVLLGNGRQTSWRSRRHGNVGKSCCHPLQTVHLSLLQPPAGEKTLLWIILHRVCVHKIPWFDNATQQKAVLM